MIWPGRSIAHSRSWLAPEVVQTSGMDCGPATLKSLLGGFGINASYDGLREACCTDVDGTSIDTVETLARELGLRAEQVLIPADHVTLRASASVPAIAVTRSASGGAHFVVVWRIVGPLVQIMDPTRGRFWISRTSLLRQLYSHTSVVDAVEWRAWAGTPEFTGALCPAPCCCRCPAGSARPIPCRPCSARPWRGKGECAAATCWSAPIRYSGSTACPAICGSPTRRGRSVACAPPAPAKPDEIGRAHV